MPSRLRFLWWRLTHPERDRVRRAIIAHAEVSGLAARDPDAAEAVAYLRGHPLHHLPYPFSDRYRPSEHRPRLDAANGLHYVVHHGKRLYWRAGRKPRRIAGDYAGLLAEQDERSPHRYCVPGFDVRAGDVVADVGCAEGILSLEVVERAGHVYLFETDERWIDALRATFRPWERKVTIVPSLVGRSSGDGVVALDDYFAGRRAPTFVKLDVEGAESDVIEGARRVLGAREVRLAACTYHRQSDEKALTELLQGMGLSASPSRGYMLLYRDRSFAPPYFRRGLVRATRARLARE